MTMAATLSRQWKTYTLSHALCLQLSDLKAFNLPLVSKALARIRKLVGHFHSSPKPTAKLREKQQQHGLPLHKLVIDCVTQWGVTYKMLARFTECSSNQYVQCS